MNIFRHITAFATVQNLVNGKYQGSGGLLGM